MVWENSSKRGWDITNLAPESIDSPPMKRYDAILIGAGAAARRIAGRLTEEGKKALIIALPGNPEDFLRNRVRALSPSPLLDPAPTTAVDTVTVKQTPRFIDETHLEVDGTALEAARFVIASGAKPFVPAMAGLTVGAVVWPEEALTEDIESAVVVGAGPIGVLTAQRLAGKDARVRLLSNKNQILPRLDVDVAAFVQRALDKSGVRTELNASAFTAEPGERIVLAAGFRPNTDGLDLKKAGVFTNERGAVVVEERMRSSSSRVYAVGAAAAGPVNLALEMSQADIAADNLLAPFFVQHRLDADVFPATVSTVPPVAHIGLTEEAARAETKHVLSVTSEADGGVLKIIGQKRSGEILGAHFAAPGAEELIIYVDLMMRAGITVHDVLENHHYPLPGPAAYLHNAFKTWSAAAAKR